MKKGIILLLIAVIMTSCDRNSADEEYEISGYDLEIEEEIDIKPPRTAEPPPLPPPPAVREVSDEGSKLIKSGSMTFEVKKLDAAKSQVDALLMRLQGYNEQVYYSAHYTQRYYRLTIRVPNANFDRLIEALENGRGKLKTKDIHVDDVTEEYIDLQIRLENKLAFLKQYKALLRRAKNVKDMVEIQDKIRRIEEEIESKKGRIKYLNDQIALSTLHLRINETVDNDDDATPSFGKRILTAFDDGVQGFLRFVLSMISMWPLLIIVALGLLFGRPLWRRVRRGLKQ